VRGQPPGVVRVAGEGNDLRIGTVVDRERILRHPVVLVKEAVQAANQVLGTHRRVDTVNGWQLERVAGDNDATALGEGRQWQHGAGNVHLAGFVDDDQVE
jgi:hypothetical protein